ncbi:hypothetical protein [Streptomyces sp. NPDC058718]
MTTIVMDVASNQEQIAFGEDLVLPLEGREIVVKTDGFPRSES